jgi:hypothetical protein
MAQTSAYVFRARVTSLHQQELQIEPRTSPASKGVNRTRLLSRLRSCFKDIHIALKGQLNSFVWRITWWDMKLGWLGSDAKSAGPYFRRKRITIGHPPASVRVYDSKLEMSRVSSVTISIATNVG